MMHRDIYIFPNGVMMFAHSYRPKWWQFGRRHFYLTPNEIEWVTEPDYGKDPSPEEVLKAYPQAERRSLTSDGFIGGTGDNTSYHTHYVVVSFGKYKRSIMGFDPRDVRYYSYDRVRYCKRRRCHVTEPVFAGDISKAEFFRSLEYAKEVAKRCRLAGAESVDTRVVYLRQRNILLDDNIVVVAKGRTGKNSRKRFVKSVDLQAGDGRLELSFTDKSSLAERFNIDSYIKLYESVHALRKDLMLFPGMLGDGEEIKASAVSGAVNVPVSFKLDIKG